MQVAVPPSLRRRTRFPKSASLLFLSVKMSTESTVFLADSANAGCAGAERFRGKSYVPPAVSNGTCMRTIGHPVLAGHGQVVSLSVCPVCCLFGARILLTPRSYRFEISRRNFAGALLIFNLISKGKFSPKFVFEISISLNCMSDAPGKDFEKITIAVIGPEPLALTHGVHEQESVPAAWQCQADKFRHVM